MSRDPLKDFVGPVVEPFTAAMSPDGYANGGGKGKQLTVRLTDEDWHLLRVLARVTKQSRGAVLARLFHLYARALRSGRDPATGARLNFDRPWASIPRWLATALSVQPKPQRKNRPERKAARKDLRYLKAGRMAVQDEELGLADRGIH